MFPHTNHIPQPPHSAGLGYKGLRPRVDHTQVPSPIQGIENDRQSWETKTYLTLPGTHAPLCTSDFIAIDQGNSSPKFVRLSTWNLPTSSRLTSECHIPISASFQPFSELDPREEPIPIVETGTTGPARCAACRAYINPWCRWVSGGLKWECNLCKHETEVLTEYFCGLDANFLRLDHHQHPELNKGTVDFDVTSAEEYWPLHPSPRITPPFYSSEPRSSGLRPPKTMDYLFAFDVSSEAISSGFLSFSCEALMSILFGGIDVHGVQLPPKIPDVCTVAILTFDSTLHFYDLSSDLTPMLVVGDLDEVFLPLQLGVFVNPGERKAAIESLLTSIPTRFSMAPQTQSALGSAIRGGLAALAGRGGHVVVFQATLPTIGAGALPQTPPAEHDMYDTEKEISLHLPRSLTWVSIAEECAEEGVGVSLFLAPNKYMDVGSVSVVSTLTGGEIFWHPKFLRERDSSAFLGQLSRLVSRMQGFNCVARVRCSNGLLVTNYYGTFQQSTPGEVTFAHLSADAAFSVELDHSKNLSTRTYAFLQCAVLYTTIAGRRRVRVINLAVTVVEFAGNVYQYADLETVLTFYAKRAMASMGQQRTLITREELTEKCSYLLLGYRTNCAQATRSTQLVIPEALLALPGFTLALQKTKPLKARQVSSDVRNFHIHRILSMTPRTLMHYLYPQLIALHDLDSEIALPKKIETSEGTVIERVVMPSRMRNSYTLMEANGVYLIDNEESMVFWIGSSVSPQILQDLFGVDDLHAVKHHRYSLPQLPTTLSTQVHNIINQRTLQRGRPCKIFVARQDTDATEIEFSDMLVEDQNNGAMSYFDYLAVVHAQISTVLNNGGSFSVGTGIRVSPW